MTFIPLADEELLRTEREAGVVVMLNTAMIVTIRPYQREDGSWSLLASTDDGNFYVGSTYGSAAAANSAMRALLAS